MGHRLKLGPVSGIRDSKAAATDPLPVLHTLSESVLHTKRFWGPENAKGALNLSRWAGWVTESRPRKACLCWVVREVQKPLDERKGKWDRKDARQRKGWV